MLDALYQETILDHGRKPRNFGPLEGATHRAEGFNPLCGDRLSLELIIVGETIMAAAFTGCGCAISQASASLLTTTIVGSTCAEAADMSARFREALTRREEPDEAPLGDLACLLGVRQFTNRVKCATLPWHTLASAVDDGRTATSESSG